MRVYIVECKVLASKKSASSSSSISSEGYRTFEEAQAFVESREGSPKAITPMLYQSEDGEMHYLIHDILIRDKKDA